MEVALPDLRMKGRICSQAVMMTDEAPAPTCVRA